MALVDSLSAAHCLPNSSAQTYGLSLPCKSNLRLKRSQGKCSKFSSGWITRVRAKESPEVGREAGSILNADVHISRREAVLQVATGAGKSLVATGLAYYAAAFRDESSGAKAATAAAAAENKTRPQFRDLDGSGGVKALDIREGTGAIPRVGDKVAIHYYARLAAKQGWRFDSSYEHKDESGAPDPYVFVIGDGTVISGLDTALRSMKEGGVRRVIIPPSQGYQNREQGPIPPNFSDRQRLYTTIFNPTRLANGEGSTLGTLVFDIELLRIRPN